MRHEDKPHPRPVMDSFDLETLRPADRHARRLGVLGHVENRNGAIMPGDRRGSTPAKQPRPAVLEYAQDVGHRDSDGLAPVLAILAA